MTQAIKVQRQFHASLLSIEAVPHGAVNLEPVQHFDGQLSLDHQNVMRLGGEVDLLELCDPRDLMLTVLEGQGSLTLNQEIVTLEPGMLVLIPAHMPHTLQTQADLTLLLSHCEPDLVTSESVWVVHL